MGYADDIPVEFLWCKDMRFHAWDPDSLVSRQVFNRRIERWEVHRTMRCFNCGTHKTQRLTTAFQPVGSPTYDYPPDYRIEGHKGYIVTADDQAAIRALSTAYRGGTAKPSAEDRMAARTAEGAPKKKTTQRRKRA